MLTKVGPHADTITRYHDYVLTYSPYLEGGLRHSGSPFYSLLEGQFHSNI